MSYGNFLYFLFFIFLPSYFYNMVGFLIKCGSKAVNDAKNGIDKRSTISGIESFSSFLDLEQL